MTLSRCSIPGAAHPRLPWSAEWPGTQRLFAPHSHTLHLSSKWVWSWFWWQSIYNLHGRCRDLNAGWVLFPLCAEPVCAVGQGVSALCCATEGQKWIFSGYSLTGVSLPQVIMKAIYPNIFMCSLYLITVTVFAESRQCLNSCGVPTLPTCPWSWKTLWKTVVDPTQVSWTAEHIH